VARRRAGPVVLSDSLEGLQRWLTTPQGQKETGLKSREIAGPSNFSSATFEAKLHEAKYTPSGEMRVVLMIKQQDKPEGQKLADAFGTGLQVTVTRKSYGK
jgi:hypothetical protein